MIQLRIEFVSLGQFFCETGRQFDLAARAGLVFLSIKELICWQLQSSGQKHQKLVELLYCTGQQVPFSNGLFSKFQIFTTSNFLDLKI